MQENNLCELVKVVLSETTKNIAGYATVARTAYFTS